MAMIDNENEMKEESKERKIRELNVAVYKSYFETSGIKYEFDDDDFIMDGTRFYIPNNTDVNGNEFQRLLEGYKENFLVLEEIKDKDIKVFEISSGVTKIGSGAFNGCKKLTKLTISNSVIKIDNWAFAGCSSLISLVIPDSVIELGVFSFLKCTGLKEITLSNSLKKIKRMNISCLLFLSHYLLKQILQCKIYVVILH